MKENSDRQIKAYMTRKFEIEMLQDVNGRYYIRYVTRDGEKFSEYITDYGTASFMFDTKLQELEGH